MKIDTKDCQFQMYKDMGWIPAKYFDMGGGLTDTPAYSDWMIYDGKEYVLKDKYGFNPHYEEKK